MSVLIRGMDEIPEDGAVLVVKHDDNGKVYIKYAGVMGYSMEIVKLPEKHGDLIDRDALRKDYQMNDDCSTCVRDVRKCEYDRNYILMDFCSWLDNEPVVIEAEGVEE